MAHTPRYQIICNGCTFHVTWRCHNKDWHLKSDEAKQIYYDLLLKYKSKYGVKIHSYSFMSNHPHLTGSMESKEEFSKFFRVVNNLFARKYNKMHGRCGQLVMDRFKSPVIETDQDLLRVMIYIDLNSVRAKIVCHPKDYRWTSYHYYADGTKNELIDPAPSYLAIADTPKERQAKYKQMVEGVLVSEGFLKRDYSTVSFIGNPDWVREKYESLKMYFQTKKKSRPKAAAPPSKKPATKPKI
jgi:putative transposase